MIGEMNILDSIGHRVVKQGSLTSGGEGLLKAAKESTAMKAAFLASQGITVEERVQQVRK